MLKEREGGTCPCSDLNWKPESYVTRTVQPLKCTISPVIRLHPGSRVRAQVFVCSLAVLSDVQVQNAQNKGMGYSSCGKVPTAVGIISCRDKWGMEVGGSCCCFSHGTIMLPFLSALHARSVLPKQSKQAVVMWLFTQEVGTEVNSGGFEKKCTLKCILALPFRLIYAQTEPSPLFGDLLAHGRCRSTQGRWS